MRIEKQWKPSVARTNSRYRGVTKKIQYTNFLLEAVHDMTILCNIMTGNEKTGMLGHELGIENNYLSIFNGDRDPGMYNIFTASKLCKAEKKKPLPLPALDKWEVVNNCTVTKKGDGFLLKSPGLLDPCGIRTPLYVMPGQVLYIRLKLKNTAPVDSFKFGSVNLNQNEGALKSLSFSQSNDGFFVDYRLYCKHQETIFLNLFVHHLPSSLKAQEIEVLSFEAMYFNELDVATMPLNHQMKSHLNQSRETINFLKK